MPTEDLPVELWLEILSYLPRSALRKMIGVNRTLFELAFNDIYEEIRLITDDKEMLKTFNQLRHDNISQRVQHLFIRPAFLPGIDETTPTSSPTSPSYSRQHIKNLLRSPTGSTLSSEFLGDRSYLVLEAAKKGVKSCDNLREVTVILHDHLITPAFNDFYRSIWQADSLGTRLHKLSIETTQAKLRSVLEPITTNFKVLRNLCDFSLMIANTRFNVTSDEAYSSMKFLMKFLKVFKAQLTSLSFSSCTEMGFYDMLDDAPELPVLHSLSLSIVFNTGNIRSFRPLFDFIQNAPSLKSLEIRPKPLNVSIMKEADAQYNKWILEPGETHLQSLRLPETLHIFIFAVSYSSLSAWNKTQLLTSITTIAPNLTSLVLSGKDQTPTEIHAMVNGLLVKCGPVVLQHLEFCCEILTPNVFDLLTSKLPSLRTLTIHATDKGVENNNVHIKAQTQFYGIMDSRRYNSSEIERIRITQPSYSCDMNMPHPDISTMRRIAPCFTKKSIVLDTQYHCDCTDSYA